MQSHRCFSCERKTHQQETNCVSAFFRKQEQNMVVPPSKFEHLPDEILSIIFRYLTTKQAYGRFYDLNQRLNRALHAVDHAIDLKEYTLAEFKQFSMVENLPVHRVAALHLTGGNKQSATSALLTDLLLTKYDLSRFQHLKSLTIDRFTQRLFAKLVSLRSLPQLITLSLHGAPPPSQPPKGLLSLFFSSDAVRFPQLQQLMLNFDFESNRPSGWCATREDVEEVTAPFREITDVQPSISSLTIRDRLHEVDLVHILQFLPNLQHLLTTLSIYPRLYEYKDVSNLTSLQLDVLAVELELIETHLFVMFPRLCHSLVVEMSIAPHARDQITRERLQLFFETLSERLDYFSIHIKHEDRCDDNEFYFEEYETSKHHIKFETVQLHNQYYGESCGTIFHSDRLVLAKQ
jgi:hypothetical protein